MMTAFWLSCRRLSSGTALAAALVAAAVVLTSGAAQASRKLVTHQGLEAHVPDDFTCANKVAVYVLGDRVADFQGERRSLQRLVGGVRATLGFECSGITDIVLVGQADGKTIWRGLVSQSNGWVLVDMPFAQKRAEPSQAAPKQVAPPPKQATVPQASPPPKQTASSTTNRVAPGRINAIPSFGGGSASARGMEQEAEFMMLMP